LLVDAPPHIPRGAGNHDGRVEERVRRIKENVRAIQCGLPFHLGPQLLTWATYYATYVSNLMPKRLGDGISPRKLLTGVKPSFKKCLPVAFGDFCQVLERDPNNTLNPRTVTAIALLPTGNGPVKFASLSTGKTITRETFKVIPNIPHEFILILKSMQERNTLGIEELLTPGTRSSEDEQKLNEEMAGNELPPLVYDPDDQGANVVQNARSDGAADGKNDGAEQMYNENEDELENENEDESEEDIEEEEEIKVLVAEAAPVDISCMSIAQAYSIYPKTNVEITNVEIAITKELQNMIDLGVFGPVEKGSDISKKMVIPSKFFLKDKGSNGTVELKERFVGGGHRQDETIYERKSSPTASPQTIFVSVMDASEKKKSVLVADVPCAYLHAERGDLPKVYVRLSREMTAIFVKLCPKYAAKVEADGTLIVEILKEILKGLYGLVESGYTWYNHLTTYLTSIGFTACKFVKCVFKKGDINLVVYVDDLLLTGPEKEIHETLDLIEKEFGDCKCKSGPTFKFIGMEFEIKNDGVAVKIDLNNLLKNTVGSAETPCGNNILSVNESVEKLTDEKREITLRDSKTFIHFETDTS